MRLIGLCLLLVVGCARPVAPAESRLVVGTNSGLAVVAPEAGRVAFSAPFGVASADASKVFALGATGGVVVLDGHSGSAEATLERPAGLVPRVVSTDGQQLALAQPYEQATGRLTTTIAVEDTQGSRPPSVLTLEGNFEPEAFSSDNTRLFVLQYVPPEAPEAYRVKQINLATSDVEPLVDRWKGVPLPQNSEESMRGTGRQQVLAPDKETLYTLYTHQPDHLHGRDLAAGLTTATGNVHAFVHTLKLNQGWAFCVDLPMPFGVGPASAHAIAVSPDGSRIVVVDRTSGSIVAIDATSLEIVATIKGIPDARADVGSAAAQFSRDGQTVYVSGGSELVTLDARSLAVKQRWPVAAATNGMSLSLDGARLYLGLPGRLAVLDAASGQEVGLFEVPELVSVRS